MRTMRSEPRVMVREFPTLRSEPITLLLACAIRLYAEGLAYSLSQKAGARIRVVGTVDDAADALHLAGELLPSVVLVDTGMHRARDVVPAIRHRSPDTRVLVLGIQESDHDVVAAAEAGACGYVPHDRSIGDLVAAVERAARGEVLCPPRIVGSLFRRIASLASDRSQTGGFAELTAREREVVELVGEGLSNKEIARRLGIRLATVKNHVHNSLGKLGVRRRSAVAAMLRRPGERGALV